MSEYRKNMFEIEAAWMGFVGSVTSIIVGLIIGIFNISLITDYPGTLQEYGDYFQGLEGEGIGIANTVTILLPIIYWIIFAVGLLGLFISLFRTNIGIRFSGFLQFLTSIAGLACLLASVLILSAQQNSIQNFLDEPQSIATYGISVPHLLFWPAIVLCGIWLIGSFLMMSAAPMNEAKF
ncbi:MAG: hypothetical protein HWN66_10210, partial [Candidatus Helarchaeota archaeon]|nr:hypothetical protein [Candidatus Helarchaeota archaeon]